MPVDLGRRPRVRVLRVGRLQVGRGAQAQREVGLLLLGTAFALFGRLVGRVENDELVLLPVAGLGGVLRALSGGRGAGRGLGQSVFAAAGLGGGVGLAVRLEGALRAAQDALAAVEGVVLVASSAFLLPGRGPLSRLPVLLGHSREAALPDAQAHELMDAPLGLLPDRLLPGHLSG